VEAKKGAYVECSKHWLGIVVLGGMATSKDFTWNETEETFQLMTRVWDVKAAKRFIATKRARPVYMIPVSSLSSLVGQPGKLSIAVTVDWEAAKTADVSIPLVLLSSESGHLPIDGYHRIARAVLDGLTELPAVVLNSTETKKVRLS
jgi:hypothetical protein